MTNHKNIVLTGSRSRTLRATASELRANGWTVLENEEPFAALSSASKIFGPIDALVFDPGLYGNRSAYELGLVATEFLATVSRAREILKDGSSGGSAIVVVSGRDALGSSQRPEIAAAAGGLVSAARSLALQLAPSGVTVNVVVEEPLADGGSPPPQRLLPAAIDDADVAKSIAFFADPRSRYITGQVLYVSAGSSLLPVCPLEHVATHSTKRIP